MWIENVWYSKYQATYRTTAGKRRRVTFYCPGNPWVRETISRILDERDDIDTAKPVRVEQRSA